MTELFFQRNRSSGNVKTFARLEKSASQCSRVGPMREATPTDRARKTAINCCKFNDTRGRDGCSCLESAFRNNNP